MGTRCIVMRDGKWVGKYNKLTSSRQRAYVYFSKKEAAHVGGTVHEVVILKPTVKEVKIWHIEYLCPVTEDKIYGPWIDKSQCDEKLAVLRSTSQIHAEFIEVGFVNDDRETGEVVLYLHNKYHETIKVVCTTVFK